MQIGPDYEKIMTTSQFQDAFGIDFAGPGLYVTEKFTLIVVLRLPDGDTTRQNVWHAVQPEGTVYTVGYFSCHISQTLLGMRSAPTRYDSYNQIYGPSEL
jgi:hypothetical protein